MTLAGGQSGRIAASPYARRLARQRGLPLNTFRGSGPDGRIVAVDVEAHTPEPATKAAKNPPPTALADPPIASANSRIAAFAATIDLRAANELLADLGAFGAAFDTVDLFLRALGLALEGSSFADIVLEGGSRPSKFEDSARLSVRALHERRMSPGQVDAQKSKGRANISLRMLPLAAIRPIVVPLPFDSAMRVVVAVDVDAARAECLVTFDTEAIDEDHAASWLGRIKSAIEMPLRLFV